MRLLDLLDRRRVGDSGKGELGRELLDVLLELGNELSSLTLALKGLDKVLEELGSSLLLGLEGDLDDTVEELGDLLDILLLHRTRGEGRRTDTDTTGDKGRGVTGNGVLVEGDVHGVTDLLDLGAGEADGAEIPEDEVVLCAVGLERVAVLEEDLSHGGGVGADSLGVVLEGGVGSLLEGNGDTGNGVVVGSTLACGEDGSVDTGLEVLLLVLAEEDETGTRTTEGLVGGGGDNVTELEGRVLLGSGNETRDVGHVGHQVCTLAVGNLAETLVLPVTGVGGTTANHKSGLEEVGVGSELLVVDDTGLGVDTVWEGLEVDGRSSDLLLGGVVTVSKVTTVGETKTHDTVLGLDESSEGSKVGSRSRVWLDVDTPDSGVKVEGLKGTLAGEVLELVNILVTTVVTSTGETFRVLVGEDGSVGLHDSE